MLGRVILSRARWIIIITKRFISFDNFLRMYERCCAFGSGATRSKNRINRSAKKVSREKLSTWNVIRDGSWIMSWEPIVILGSWLFSRDQRIVWPVCRERMLVIIVYSIQLSLPEFTRTSLASKMLRNHPTNPDEVKIVHRLAIKNSNPRIQFLSKCWMPWIP